MPNASTNRHMVWFMLQSAMVRYRWLFKYVKWQWLCERTYAANQCSWLELFVMCSFWLTCRHYCIVSTFIANRHLHGIFRSSSLQQCAMPSAFDMSCSCSKFGNRRLLHMASPRCFASAPPLCTHKHGHKLCKAVSSGVGACVSEINNPLQ